jgi:NADH dehydrogenase FAD-containing subunit
MSLDSLLLLGAGPANRLILRSLINHQRADTRVTLITPHSQALPPAGMSGLVGGSRTLEQSVVDLEPLLKASGARHLSASCSTLDAAAQVLGVTTREGEPQQLSYRFLSIDTGPQVDRDAIESLVPGADANAMFLRPLETFARLWPQFLALGRERPLSIAVIGADCLAVELAFALQFVLPNSRVTLITEGREPAAEGPAGLRERVLRRLREKQITVLKEHCVGIEVGQVWLGGGATLACDAPIMACEPQAPEWLRNSGLALNESGFITLNDKLQSSSHPSVFAAGAVAARPDGQNPLGADPGKRESRALAANLMAAIAGTNLNAWRSPTRRWHWVACGEPWAIASLGSVSLEGRWVWRLLETAKRRQWRLENTLR